MKKILLVLAVLLMAVAAQGQDDNGTLMQFYNATTLLGSARRSVVFKCDGTGLVCTKSGSTVTLTSVGGASAAGGANTQVQFNSVGALGGITQWTTNGTTTFVSSATGVLDLHLAATSGLLLPGALATGIVKVTTATGAISTAVAGDFPTLNQTTTGTASAWTTPRLLAGNSVDGSANATFANKFIVQGTTDTGLSAAQFLGALATGLVKNTTTTGVLSAAASPDVIGLFSGTCNTTTFLRGDGSCQAAGTGTFTGGNVTGDANFCGPNPYISVTCPTYGALHNGTDDAPRIQAAIDAAVANGGGTVYFPRGDYALKSTQGTSGANLVINGQGVRLLGCGSANEESQSASCAILDQTVQHTLTAPTQGAFALVSATSCDTAGGAFGLESSGAPCHTVGEGGTYRAVQQNNSGGVLADSSQWLLFYTLTDPYLCPTCETMESPLRAVTMNANGNDGSLIVLSPDWEGRGRMWNLYICPTSNGTTCSVAEKRYTATNACRNKFSSPTLNHTPTSLGCWIGESMYVLADPTTTGGGASPGASTMTNNDTVVKIENNLASAVKTGPTIENLEIDTQTDKGGIAIHNHAGQQVTILNTVVKGDVTSTAGIGFTGYLQSGHVAPGGTRFANQTFISHFGVLKAWHAMDIMSPGSIQAGGLSLYTTTDAVACVPNTPPLPIDNCSAGITSLGTSNISIFGGHIDVGSASPSSTGIFVNGNNNLSTSSSGQAIIISNFRIEGGCPTTPCTGTESVAFRGVNTNGINANYLSTFNGTGLTAGMLDSASIGNYMNIDVPPNAGVTPFSGNAINNLICDVKVGKCSATNGTFSGSLSAQRSSTDTVSCPNNTTGNFATTYTIPASYLVANKVLRVTLGMGLISTAGPTMGVNLLVGGTTVFSATPAIPATTSTATVNTGMVFYIQGTAAAGGSVAVNTDNMGLPTSGANFAPFAKSITTQPVNLATNGTLVIQPQLFCSVNTAGNSMILRQMIVEALN